MLINKQNFNEIADCHIRVIEEELPHEVKVSFEKIAPFVNYCRVDNSHEHCNIIVEYVPDKKLLDIVSHREFFRDNKFNMYIEGMASCYYEYLKKALKPKKLRVVAYLEDVKLTRWNCECSDF